MSFLLKSSKPHSCGYGFYTGWPEIIQRNCNIISEFYWIHVQFNRKKGNLHTQQRVETNTHIESFISNTVYEWRLPDVLCILLLVCVFFSTFIHPTCHLLSTPSGTVYTPAKNGRQHSTTQSAMMPKKKYSTLNWICLCHFIYYTHLNIARRWHLFYIKMQRIQMAWQKWVASVPNVYAHRVP